ncbi:MAG: GTPase HflX [Rhodobacterales bacterium]|nr:MAG: GTPase HflX [Rhodobacterales bacterium]
MEIDPPRQTRAWVLHPEIKSDNSRRAAAPALQEAVSLTNAMPDMLVVGAEIVPLRKVRAGVLFGKGKIADLKATFKAQDIELVLIDGALTPVQQRNLEQEWDVKILDRTGLILEIFSDRARTREGVLQVEMAALSYQRTRLVRAWTHLERQRGGLGFVGGPGETQIEADRRAIDEAITRLKRQLSKVVKTRELHRASRKKVPFPVVALVGYTNAGKSTLFNRLTGAKVMAKDMLFATLDPTMRSVVLPSGQEIILSDTVGFISDLPTELVAAFRATLEEVLDADLLIHVRDISHVDTVEQARNVAAVLDQLGVPEDAKMLELWNKIDLLEPEEQAARIEQASRHEDKFAISSVTGQGIDAVLQAISDQLTDPKTACELLIPYAEGRKRAWLFEQGLLTSEESTDEGFRVQVLWTARQQKQYREM